MSTITTKDGTLLQGLGQRTAPSSSAMAGRSARNAFSETDFTEDLKRFDVPTLIIHGDDDQIAARRARRSG